MSQQVDEPADEESTAEERRAAVAEDARAHLQDIEDGCGCAEVWEHLSEQRAADD